MLTVEDCEKIRIAKRDGMSIRAICRTHHHSHYTVTKALENPQLRPYTLTKPTAAPVLGPFMPIIDQILLDEEAEKLLLEAVEGRRLKLGDNHPHTLESINNLIVLYEAWGKPEKAKEWRAKLLQAENTRK